MANARQIAVIAGVVAAFLAIGINRIVVTDGNVAAASAPLQTYDGVAIAFKSDYLPLER